MKTKTKKRLAMKNKEILFKMTDFPELQLICHIKDNDEAFIHRFSSKINILDNILTIIIFIIFIYYP